MVSPGASVKRSKRRLEKPHRFPTILPRLQRRASLRLLSLESSAGQAYRSAPGTLEEP